MASTFETLPAIKIERGYVLQKPQLNLAELSVDFSLCSRRSQQTSNKTELNAVDAVLFEKVAEYIYKDIYVFETHRATSFNVLKQMNVISSNPLSECLLGLSF